VLAWGGDRESPVSPSTAACGRGAVSQGGCVLQVGWGWWSRSRRAAPAPRRGQGRWRRPSPRGGGGGTRRPVSGCRGLCGTGRPRAEAASHGAAGSCRARSRHRAGALGEALGGSGCPTPPEWVWVLGGGVVVEGAAASGHFPTAPARGEPAAPGARALTLSGTLRQGRGQPALSWLRTRPPAPPGEAARSSRPAPPRWRDQVSLSHASGSGRRQRGGGRQTARASSSVGVELRGAGRWRGSAVRRRLRARLGALLEQRDGRHGSGGAEWEPWVGAVGPLGFRFGRGSGGKLLLNLCSSF